MADLMKEEVRQTTGAAVAPAAVVQVDDGTAAGNVTVLDDIVTGPLASDNPMLVWALLKVGALSLGVIPYGGTDYDPGPTPSAPAATNWLATAGMVMGPQGPGPNTQLNAASVVQFQALPVAADYALMTKPTGNVSHLSQFARAATAYDQATLALGALNPLVDLGILCGPNVADGNTNVRMASVAPLSLDPTNSENGLITNATVRGQVAHDGAAISSQRPVLVGGVATQATPSAVSGDADIVQASMTRYGETRVMDGHATIIASHDGRAVTLVAATPATIAAAPGRRYLEIQNKSGAAVFMRLGGAVSNTDYEIANGAAWYSSSANGLFTGEVQILSTAGGQVNILEYGA